MSYVFISYSHEDKKYAHRLEEELKQRGFEVWLDDRIDYGAQWPKTIQEKLDGCDAFVVIMTEHSYDSEWVQKEVARANQRRLKIFPLLLWGDVPWLSVQDTQYTDVRDRSLPPTDFYDTLAKVVPRKGIYPIQVPSPGEVARVELATENRAVGKYAVLRFDLRSLIEHSEIRWLLQRIGFPTGGIIKCNPEILEELRTYDSERLFQDSQEKMRFPRDLGRIGGRLWQLLFQDKVLVRSFYKHVGAAGGMEGISLVFVVDNDTSRLPLESLLYEDEKFWILHAPLYRTLGLETLGTGLFATGIKSEMPINCLIIEAPVGGYVPELDLDLRVNPRTQIEEESRQLEEFMTKNMSEFNISQVRRIAGGSSGQFAELLAETLSEERWDVVHYIGTHVWVAEAQKAHVLLPDEKRISRLLRVDQFAYWLRQSRTKFVYLSTSGNEGSDVVFQFARYGQLAVLGFRASDMNSMMFHAESFYRNLLKDRELGAALLSTRRWLYEATPNDHAWANSILYVTTP